MRHKLIVAWTLAALLAVAGGAAAQHQDQRTSPGMMGQGMTDGGMMGMMNQTNQTMGQMMTRHQQMSDLMTKLMDSMKAIESEKDPAALQQKLAAHRALLDQMHAQMMQEGGMMQQMMGTSGQPPAAK